MLCLCIWRHTCMSELLFPVYFVHIYPIVLILQLHFPTRMNKVDLNVSVLQTSQLCLCRVEQEIQDYGCRNRIYLQQPHESLQLHHQLPPALLQGRHAPLQLILPVPAGRKQTEELLLQVKNNILTHPTDRVAEWGRGGLTHTPEQSQFCQEGGVLLGFLWRCLGRLLML